MITRHPSRQMLKGYAEGLLPSGPALAIACHGHACGVCRREIQSEEAIGGERLEAMDPVALDGLSLRRALERVERSKPGKFPQIPRILQKFELPPPLLEREIGPRVWLSPRIWFAPVYSMSLPRGRESTYLLWGRKNTLVPQHAHSGGEVTTILAGSFADGGELFHAGDFIRLGRDAHAPRVSSGSDCLCLIGADGPMRFTGLLPRAVQAMTGTRF